MACFSLFFGSSEIIPEIITFSPTLFSIFKSKDFESLISYLNIPRENEIIKINRKNIFCLLSTSKTINLLNKNNIIETKTRKKEKVIPILTKEHKKIARTKPVTDIIKEVLFFTKIF